jgi:8-oxo-dGTP pyrophosphatase MutT (NUDIX family)
MSNASASGAATMDANEIDLAHLKLEDLPVKVMTMIYVVNFEEHKVLLGYKARGFGAGKWNAFGGKVESSDRSIRHGAMRELHEESGLLCTSLQRRGVLYFQYPEDLEKRVLEVHVFIADAKHAKADIKESEEMTPIQWFDFSAIPLDRMWADDPHWLPQLLERLRQERGEQKLAPRGFAGVFRFKSFEEVGHVQVVTDLPLNLPGHRLDVDAG